MTQQTKEKETRTTRSTHKETPQKRVDKHHQKNKAKDQEKDTKPTRWVQIRLLPIWLRIVLILLLLAGMCALGLIVGFSIVGDGAPMDVFKKETWTHITDMIRGIE